MSRVVLALFLVVGIIMANDVLVKAADKDRILKLQDGKRIKLKAGMELVRSKDGKLFARKGKVTESRQKDFSVPPKKSENKSVNANSLNNSLISGQSRFKWFVGGDLIARSIEQEYIYKTDKVLGINHLVFDPTGERFYADGKEYKFTAKQQESLVAGSFGLKDMHKENRYFISYQPGKNFTELAGAVEFGFGSMKFLDRFIPYARVNVSAAFRDGVGSFKANAVSYGGGAGVSYLLDEKFEFYSGADLLMRNWGEIPARSTKTGTTQMVSYGTESHKDKEMRFYAGARYFF